MGRILQQQLQSVYSSLSAVCVCTSRDGDWWYAENTASGRRGYIPSNYVAQVNSIRQFEYVT